MPSPNKTTINGLIGALQSKEIRREVIYDLATRLSDDLNKVYEALFDGPLPAVSGENLDLTLVPQNKLPDSIAFLNVENIFTANQNITAELAEFNLSYLDTATNVPGEILGRMMMIGDGNLLVSSNLGYDGSDFFVDSGTLGAGLNILANGGISLFQTDGVDFYYPFKVDDNRIIQLGNPIFYTDADEDDIVIAQGKIIRSSNSGDDRTISMIMLNDDDLVYLGIDADPDGTGHVGIPKFDFADLPAAAASQDGTIVIDKTNNRFCFYEGGSRYYVTGTAF